MSNPIAPAPIIKGQTVCHLRSLSAQRTRTFELALFTAWHVAALSRVERLPELAPLLEQMRTGGDEGQDAKEQIAAARGIVAAFGSAEETR